MTLLELLNRDPSLVPAYQQWRDSQIGVAFREELQLRARALPLIEPTAEEALQAYGLKAGHGTDLNIFENADKMIAGEDVPINKSHPVVRDLIVNENWSEADAINMVKQYGSQTGG